MDKLTSTELLAFKEEHRKLGNNKSAFMTALGELMTGEGLQIVCTKKKTTSSCSTQTGISKYNRGHSLRRLKSWHVKIHGVRICIVERIE